MPTAAGRPSQARRSPWCRNCLAAHRHEFLHRRAVRGGFLHQHGIIAASRSTSACSRIRQGSDRPRAAPATSCGPPASRAWSRATVSSSIASAGLHGGDDAGADRRRSPRHRVVGDLEDRRRAVEDRGVAFDMKGKDRRADHDNKIMVTKGVRQLRRRGMKEARELRMPFRKTAARRKRADPDRGARFLRHAHQEIDGLARSTPGPTTSAGRLLSASAVASRPIAAGSGPNSRLTLRASTGCAGWVQSSIGTETKVGPQGGCIAT